MYFLLILFFGSLLGISFMIGRKVLVLENGQIFHKNKTSLKTSYLEELKHSAIKNMKKYGYAGLVTTIRFYVRSMKILNNKYKKIKIKIKNIHYKKSNTVENKQEISKFLKIISEYKHKIREIKHKITEEEEKL